MSKNIRISKEVYDKLKEFKGRRTWSEAIEKLLFFTSDEFDELYNFFARKMFELEKALATSGKFTSNTPSKIEYYYKLLLVDILFKIGKRPKGDKNAMRKT